MYVAKGMDEVAGLQATHLCHHHGEKGIGGDIERHAEEYVGATLIELARQFAVSHIELEEGMARWECRLASRYVGGKVLLVLIGQHTWIPRRDDMPATVGVRLDAFHHLLDLVDAFVVPVAPLCTIDGS